MSSIFDVLLNGTLADAQLWSLPNIKGEGQERWIGTRKDARIKNFITRRDERGYGTFFCVSTIAPGERRKKEFARELPYLFADVDFKDIDLTPEAIEVVLRDGLDCPPTRMHHTGNGIHCFWMLDAPVLADGMDAAEVVLRKLANHVGGDISVAHRVALLRVPGTHNSKRGEWRLVTAIKEGQETYTLNQLDAWLGSARDPALVRRDRETNAFVRVGQEQGFRAPIDVEVRLREMEVNGAGDAGVHNTQLSCTAALMNAGVEVEDAVALVLDATMALAGTDGWNWAEEERNLREMCDDFRKKHGNKSRALQPIGPALSELVNASPPSGVVSLAAARLKREKPEDDDDEEREERKAATLDKLNKKKKNEHVVLGKGILASLEEEGRQIMYAQNQCWMYKDGVWTAMSADEERTWASCLVEEGCQQHGLISTTKIVNETRAWLQRAPELHQKEVEWDAHGMIATMDGLYDWRTDELHPLQPTDFVTRILDCEFREEAQCPIWNRMLSQDYELTASTISFLQELAGVSLVLKKPRTLTRALVLLGPSNTGKSNILNVLAGLSSAEHNPTPIEAVEGAHGLMSFLKPNPWVLHEAFDQSRWEMSAKVKALLSGDVVHVNVKNGPMIPLVFNQPVFWGTNVPPQFREASRAMENRLAIVRVVKVFDPLHITGTAQEALDKGLRTPAELVLSEEKSGVLNWAITGLKRAMARGHFVFTNEMQESLQSMRADSNMAIGFINECCEFDPNYYIDTADFYGAFTVWHNDHRGGQSPSVDSLGRAMHNLSDARVVGDRINRKRIYAGLKLNEEGLDCWNARSASAQAERSGMRLSERDTDVNKLLTPETMQRGEFLAMRRAHGA